MPSSPGHVWALVADAAGQRACIDPGEADQIVLPEPAVEALDRAPVGRLGDVGTDDQPTRGGRRGLDVLRVGADIADMGEGEIDDLPGVGRVGHDLLVAGDRGVEADLADLGSDGADAAAPIDRSIIQHQSGGRTGGARGTRLRADGVGHDRLLDRKGRAYL